MKISINNLLPIVLILSLHVANAQESYEVGDFYALSANSGVNVVLQKGSYPSIQNPDNVPIEVKNDNGNLNISMKKGSYSFKGKKSIIVRYTNLSSISVNGGANIKSSSPINSSKLALSANGGGNLHCQISGSQTSARANGGGNIHLKGSSRALSLATTGGGNIDASELNAQNVEASAVSGGNINVQVNGALTAKAVSGGNIVYSGNPTAVNVNKASGGRVVGSKTNTRTKTTTKKPSKPRVAY